MNNKPTVMIISWDVTHNALGRAYMLAEALSKNYKPYIVGFIFKSHGNSVWAPLKDTKIPLSTYPGSNFPAFSETLQKAASEIDADVILVSKPRIPSLQLGLMLKVFRNRPLILDIDDFEAGFIAERRDFEREDIKKPHGEIWTSYCEQLIGYADHIFVSNKALQKKYGGTIIPHARDEKVFNPQLYDRKERRKELGIALDDKVILFLGTPKYHKGLLTLMRAIKACDEPSYKLCVMGSFPGSKLKEDLLQIGGEQLLLYPDQPFLEVAKNMSIADLVCVLQDDKKESAKYQLPAKVIDAIAMGISVLSTRIPSLEPLIDQELIIPTNIEGLADNIRCILSRADYYRAKQLEKRTIFLEHYSYSAILKKMESVIANTIKRPKVLPERALSFTELQSGFLEELTLLVDPLREHNFELKARIIKADREKRKAKEELNAIAQSRTWRLMKLLSKPVNIFKRS